MSNEENQDPVFKRVLNRCRESLRDDMDFDSMCDYLISKEVIRTTKINDIKDEKYTSEKKRKLIDAIATAGRDSYTVFKKGLKDTKQRHLYDLLNKEEESLAKESKEKNPSVQGGRPGKATTSDNAARTVTEVGKTIPTRRDTDIAKDMEHLPEDLQRTNLNNEKNMQQPVAPTTTINVSKNVPDSACTLSNSVRSFGSSQLFGGDSKTAEMRASNVCDGPTVEPANTDDTTCQPQSTQLTDNLQNQPSEQPISFGNLTSYQDMHETDTTEDLTSSLKQEHYAEDATNQPKMTTERKESVRDQSISYAVGHGTGAYGQQTSTVGTRGAASREGVVPVPIDDCLPDPASITAPVAGPEHPAIANISQGSADESRDDDGYLTEHFDACVIYEAIDRNRADEVKKFLEDLNYKVCLYDDAKYFDLFVPDGLPSVIIKHCVLLLIIISHNLEAHEDEHTKYIRSTISMALKNSAKIRPVLFQGEEKKFIPTSLSNTRPIAWYNKDKDFFRENLFDLLKQCKPLRIKMEEQKVKTKKHIDH